MKLPFATPASSRRPSEAGSQLLSSDNEADQPWGVVLGHLATVARHDPRAEVTSTQRLLVHACMPAVACDHITSCVRNMQVPVVAHCEGVQRVTSDSYAA